MHNVELHVTASELMAATISYVGSPIVAHIRRQTK